MLVLEWSLVYLFGCTSSTVELQMLATYMTMDYGKNLQISAAPDHRSKGRTYEVKT